ncbi:ornithine cyclodeaminase [Faunimonas pinastri]|uniref:Ornithine cyclodeaminase n=1 Tax=Faunimonas pinastri TaxID=1855383 RepID=A0A1H9K441_9HYPH|nr:delta(1)-pyrroline-2-carboxylate reductase family protein [Faunimonas pinastri]SEQ93914.1 ornithine cyclodeaminase [Faunimonas pinastri]
MDIHDAAATARLLDYPSLIETLATVVEEYGRGEIVSPERLVVPTGDRRGLLLSMPCDARDIVAHKLLTIYSGNPASGLPAIQGQVTAFDAANGTPLFCLDGPTVTARRTAAITLLGIRHLAPSAPRSVLLIGTGAQALGHVEALLAIYPEVSIRVRGRSAASARVFCERAGGRHGQVVPDSTAAGPVDVVIAVTSSKIPVYDEEADAARLVVGVGAYRLDMIEIGARLIRGSQVYVDDPIGAPVEAGDIAAAGTDWSTVRPLASALSGQSDFARPIFFKSVGCAAWDLAACRAARTALTRL